MADKIITDEELFGASAGSSDNVVTFKSNPPTTEPEEDMSKYILVCQDCKCTTFQVKLNGDLVCAECDLESSEYAPQLNFARHVPENAEEIDNFDGAKKVTRFQKEGDLTRARVVKRINEWYKDNSLIFAVAYSEGNGAIQWTGVETATEREWVYRQIDGMKRWLGTFEMDDSEPSRDFAKEK